MRQIDRIRRMSLEEMAPLLVQSTEVEDIGDYDWDENPIAWYVTVWHSPSGDVFYDHQDAINDCIQWLGSELLIEDTQVYCKKCYHFWIDESETPQCEYCRECDLSDSEDSSPYKERPKYTELYRKRDNDD